jgi:hypothetical protein
MKTILHKTIPSFLFAVFFLSQGPFVYSEQPSPERLIVGHDTPYREEINLSEFDDGFDFPALSNNKEPVTQTFSFHKYLLILNSGHFRYYDYKKYYFIFSSYLRNKHFLLGEHSSLRAPPGIA